MKNNNKDTISAFKRMFNPPEPVMPPEVEEFIKTEFGKIVHQYYMDELQYLMANGYNEFLDELNLEREKTKALKAEVEALRNLTNKE